jgi:hypothetical protein
MKIALCLLTHDHLRGLEKVLPKLPPPGPQAGYDEIVALDGGSTDGSLALLEARQIRIAASGVRGRGEAYLAAIERVPADAWIFFTPDGSDAPEELPRFRPALERGADLVIASRLREGGLTGEQGPLTPRRWVHFGLSQAANRLFGQARPFVSDVASGYRALTRRGAERLALDAADRSVDVQMTVRALEEGLTVAEFSTVEGPRVTGETRADKVRAGYEALRRVGWELRRARSRR